MELDHLVSECADASAETEPWQKALKETREKAGWVFPPTRAFVQFAMSFPSPEEWLAFAGLMNEAEDLAVFLSAVDNSGHSPKEWTSALQSLSAWLEQKGREISMERRIGYLACCAEATSTTHPLLDLADVTMEMLNAHGLE
jgi:hypothetical protein